MSVHEGSDDDRKLRRDLAVIDARRLTYDQSPAHQLSRLARQPDTLELLGRHHGNRFSWHAHSITRLGVMDKLATYDDASS